MRKPTAVAALQDSKNERDASGQSGTRMGACHVRMVRSRWMGPAPASEAGEMAGAADKDGRGPLLQLVQAQASAGRRVMSGRLPLLWCGLNHLHAAHYFGVRSAFTGITAICPGTLPIDQPSPPVPGSDAP